MLITDALAALSAQFCILTAPSEVKLKGGAMATTSGLLYLNPTIATTELVEARHVSTTTTSRQSIFFTVADSTGISHD